MLRRFISYKRRQHVSIAIRRFPLLLKAFRFVLYKCHYVMMMVMMTMISGSGSVNEYQLRLVRQRQVWLIPSADERGVCR